MNLSKKFKKGCRFKDLKLFWVIFFQKILFKKKMASINKEDQFHKLKELNITDTKNK
jgi:hypothetical protein